MMPAEPVLTRIRVKNKNTVQKKKSWEIPRDTKEPAVPIHISTKEGREIGRGAHIYRLNAKCHPQKKK
jgi:hypothetical protein